MDILKNFRSDAVPIYGLRVRSRRETLGLTQQELATAVGRSRGYISGIEHGKHSKVSRTTASSLANTLGVLTSDLIADAEASEEFFGFPVDSDFDMDVLYEELKQVIQSPRLTEQQRAEAIGLIRSHVAWLRFRYGGAHAG